MSQKSGLFLAKKTRLLNASKAKETERALNKQWVLYQNWCSAHSLPSFPVKKEVYEAYFIHLLDKGLKRSSIDQAKWALDAWHKQNNQPLLSEKEEIKTFFKGLHRLIGFRQSQKKELTIDHIRQMKFNQNLIGLRDKTLLLIGFCGGLRRSEITALLAEDTDFSSLGVKLTIAKSKTNQYGFREEVDIPFAKDESLCPVLHLQSWLEKTDITQGALFRSFRRGFHLSKKQLSDHQVALIVKKYAASINLDPNHYSGHSLRAGCATYLLRNNVPLNIVAKQLRHRKLDTTLKYDRNLVHSSISGLF